MKHLMSSLRATATLARAFALSRYQSPIELFQLLVMLTALGSQAPAS